MGYTKSAHAALLRSLLAQQRSCQAMDLSAERHGSRKLMEAILAYSAVENAPQRRAVISLEEPLQIALQNLQHHIQEAGATIDVRALPSLSTDRTQMVMVFQNLIGNAIK